MSSTAARRTASVRNAASQVGWKKFIQKAPLFRIRIHIHLVRKVSKEGKNEELPWLELRRALQRAEGVFWSFNVLKRGQRKSKKPFKSLWHKELDFFIFIFLVLNKQPVQCVLGGSIRCPCFKQKYIKIFSGSWKPHSVWSYYPPCGWMNFSLQCKGLKSIIWP